MIADLLFRLAENLLARRDALRSASIEDRARIATWLSCVSECLSGCSVEFRAGQTPHGRCAELGIYATEAVTLLATPLGSGDALDIATDLSEAHNVERMEYEIGGAGEEALIALDRAAGTFRALANTVRAR